MAKKKTLPPPPPSRGSKNHRAPAPKAKSGATVESKPTRSTPVPSSATARQVSRDEVARAAYLRWQRSGGDAATNWLLAERELRAKR